MSSQSTDSPFLKTIAEPYQDLPLHFEANQGQTNDQVRFLSNGSGYSFFLTRSGAVLTFAHDSQSQGITLHMKLAGANPNAHIRGIDQLRGKSNYFFGNDSQRWRTAVPTYAKVGYDDVYPGINLVYYGSQRQLEYDFVIAAGADPGQVRLAVSGAQSLTLDSQGNLVLHSTAGDVQLLAPRAYQQINGVQHKISGEWKLFANNVAGFHVGEYDRTQPLVIDPVLTYSSFLGGSQKNALNKIAVDADGNTYVAGYTASGDFPAAPTPQSMTFGGGTTSRGAFIAKIDPTGSTMLYSTYLSGSADEEATGLAVDRSGYVYVAGTTHSADFPTRNPLQPTCATHMEGGGCSSAFLTKISPTGDSILFSTYLGGSGGESARGLAVDAAGSAYIAGVTSSLDFPVTSAAFQTKCAGACQQNAFVAKFSPSGDRLAYATYLGGSGTDDAADIAVDASGNAYVAGHTTSHDFPLSTPYQRTCASDVSSSTGACVSTAFVTKLNADGGRLAYSSYLGGSFGSQASGIAVDAAGSAYIAGSTLSSDFPVQNAFQKSCGKTAGQCSIDAFVTKLAPSGKTLVYSTYLGGSGRDEAFGIAVDAAGNAHIVGRTESADFPTVSSSQKQLQGASDAFVARLNAAGTALTFSTYHGGSAIESGNAIALDPKGNVYVTGETSSPDFPTLHPFQSSCAGSCASAFVSKMAALVPGTTASTTVLTSGTNPSVFGESVTLTATVTGAAGTPTGTVDFMDGATSLGTGTLNGTGVATLTISSLATGSHSLTGVYSGDTTYATSTSNTVTQVVNKANTTTSVGSSANPSTFNESVTFTATVAAVAPGAGTPAGTVTFKDNGTAISGAVTLAAGSATFSTSTLSVATHPITVTYSGNADFNTSTSTPAINQVVNKAATTTQVNSSVNPSSFNQSVTFTATVTGANGGTPTGTVVFSDNGTAISGAVTLSAGSATFSTATLSVGTHPITATYSGDTDFTTSTSTPALNQVVNKAATTTQVVSSLNPSNFNQSVTFTATVTASGSGPTPTGTVVFNDNGTAISGTVTLTAGSATFTTSALSVGTHPITATYSGDTSYSGSTSTPPLQQVVNKAPTTTALNSSLNPSTVNQSVTFTATVTSTLGNPTGTVTFDDNGTAISTAIAINGSGVATFTTSALVAATHSITAVYSGDTNFATSTSTPVSQVVNKGTTTTALASSLNPSTVNQPVTFTATITPSPSGTPIAPGGTVTFNDGGSAIGTGTLNASLQATFTTATLAVGTHSITAVYAGDSNFTGSTSSAVSQVVNQTATSTTISSSSNPSIIDQPVTFTATVTPAVTGTFAPTGTVTFNDGTTAIGTGTLNASLQATFTTAGLNRPSHSITAVYGGDSGFITSTSSALTQTVNQTGTTTTFTYVVNLDQTIAFTATVTPALTGVFVPSGTVSFMDGATLLGSGTVNAQLQATFTTTAALGSGTHSITAVYSGDVNFITSTSGAVSISFATQPAQSPVISGGVSNSQTLANVAAASVHVTYSCLSLTGTGITTPLAATSNGFPSVAIYCLFTPTSPTVVAPNTVSLMVCTGGGCLPGSAVLSRSRQAPTMDKRTAAALYLQGVGFLGIVFVGTGVSIFAFRNHAMKRRAILKVLGLSMVMLLLSIALGCGGGFSGKVVPPGTSPGNAPAGTYSLTVMGAGQEDQSAQVYTVPITVTPPL